MKKIINNADNFVEESISGLVKSYPEIYKYSSETNKVLSNENKGLIEIKGPHVFSGYLNDNEATKKMLETFPDAKITKVTEDTDA